MNYSSISTLSRGHSGKSDQPKQRDDDYVKENGNSSLWILTLLSAIDGADAALLPASFRALETDLSFTPEMLAQLAVCQGVASAVFCPIWGNLADNGVSRKNLLVSGALVWGLMTLLLACVNDFTLMVPLRVANGAALGLIVPVSQSLVADLSPKSSIGFSFGRIESGKSVGSVLATFACVAVSTSNVLGFQGWRVAFVTVGILSLLTALIVHVFLFERKTNWNPSGIGIISEIKRFSGFFTIPTFAAIVMQGMFGCIPWAALQFGSMYFQYSGMSSAHAGIVSSTLGIGTTLGTILGGSVGDTLTQWSRYHGRPLCAQISVLLGIPLVYVLYGSSSTGPSTWGFATIVSFTLGLVASWCATGVNRPIFLDIVPARNWASSYAWLSCMESTAGNVFGATSVGYLSMRFFNYVPTAYPVSQMSETTRLANHRALGQSLVLATCLPWCLCFASYSLLHCTYERDCVAVKQGGEEAPVNPA